jgi:hypothetical protein
MLCNGEPEHNTPTTGSGHQLFEIEQDALWEVAQNRLESDGESTDDDRIEAHLEPIAQATAERFVRAYLAHDALLAYAKWEEESDAQDALYNESAPRAERSRAYHALIAKWFPAIVAKYPLLTPEEMVAEEYGQELTPWEIWEEDSSVMEAVGEAYIALRHAALKACGEKILVRCDYGALILVGEPAS